MHYGMLEAARSIKLKVPILFDLVMSNNIDILAITESWLTEDHQQDLCSVLNCH